MLFAKLLKFGNVVVFKYVGGSCFQLEIFGTNCVEIDYSKFIDEQVKKEFVEVVDDHETNIAGAGTSQRRKRGKKISS
jgi:hypothetical protein